WAQYDITVNAIAPGFFPTKMTKGIMEMLGDRVAERAPLKRLGGPEDLKGLVVLLASDASAFITGQIIAVDGGVTAIYGRRPVARDDRRESTRRYASGRARARLRRRRAGALSRGTGAGLSRTGRR